jgi:transcriptional regulator with XRE-family HTH domain
MNLADLRRERGLTQADLAHKSGVSPGTISKIELGTHNPRPNTRRLICKALRWPWRDQATLFGPVSRLGRPTQTKPNGR